jgi:hypothetical protein
MTLSDDTRRSASVAGCVRFVCLQDRIDSRRQRPWAGRHIARVKEGARVPGADATLCERRKRRLSPADRVCRRVVRCQCADRTPPRRVQIHGHCSAATSQKRTCCSPFVWDHTHSMTTEGGHIQFCIRVPTAGNLRPQRVSMHPPILCGARTWRSRRTCRTASIWTRTKP